MENHLFYWENSLFQWPFSIAMFVYQMVTYRRWWVDDWFGDFAIRIIVIGDYFIIQEWRIPILTNQDEIKNERGI